MKKSLVLGGAFLSFAAITVVAATMTFTDAGSFPSWAKDSIQRMADKGVVNGYADGSFQPNKNVSRGEVTTMLDRLDQKLSSQIANDDQTSSTDRVSKEEMQKALADLEKKLTDELTPADPETAPLEETVQRTLFAYDKYSSLDIDRNYKIYIVMAEAGIKKMQTALEMKPGITKVVGVNLPQGYSLYQEMGIVFRYYVNYKGPKQEGDVMMEVDEWYGPYSPVFGTPNEEL